VIKRANQLQSATAVALALAFVILVLLLAGCGDAASSSDSGDSFLGWWFTDDPEIDYGPSNLVASDGAYVFAEADGSVGTNPRFVLRGDQLVMEGEDERNYDHLSLSDDGRQLYVDYSMDGVSESVTWRRGTDDEVHNAQTIQNLNAVDTALKAWRQRHGTCPTVDEVTPTGSLSDSLKPWPANAFTGQAMSVGDGAGQFRYSVADGRRTFALVCYLADGSIYRIPVK
jgi:hypothetical protein